jgi:hypothetical protein
VAVVAVGPASATASFSVTLLLAIFNARLSGSTGSSRPPRSSSWYCGSFLMLIVRFLGTGTLAKIG